VYTAPGGRDNQVSGKKKADRMGQASTKEYFPLNGGLNSDQNILLQRLEPGDSSEDELYAADDVCDIDSTIQNDSISDGTSEKWYSTLLQIFLPFIVAGLGMVAAGLVLDHVQHWKVFVEIPEIMILVPALLGLKGNLEMTLASRLSSAANLGKMDAKEDALSLITGNLALIQCQAIVVGFLASITGMLMGWGPAGKLNMDHGLLLCASSVVTASLASFVLGIVMVLVIIGSRAVRINPDNVATPIAASLGDLITLTLLSWIASLLWADLDKDKWLAPLIICSYLLFTPLCLCIAWRNSNTKDVLLYGWTPVLIAMLVSSGGGLILDYAVAKFHGIAVFQPVMNGVGGNLVAVQASRMSTYLHTSSGGSGPGVLPMKDEGVCVTPWSIVCSDDPHARTARILLLLVIPGHVIFAYTISYLEAGHTSPTLLFFVFYLSAAWLQVALLLYVCRVMVFSMWSRGTDPDNSAIPYLTALGDLLGGGFLAIAFLLLHLLGEMEPSNSPIVAKGPQ